MNPRLLAALWVPACCLYGQSVQTSLCRAVMGPANGASGVTDISVHVVKDSANNVISGSVDLDVTYQFPDDEQVNSLKLTNGTTTITTDINTASPVRATAGRGRIQRQVQTSAANLSSFLANPGQYSVTLSASGLALSGTPQAAATAVRMAVVNSTAGSGVATVQVLYTGAAYAITSAEVTMQLAYQFFSQVTFSGMRIYNGGQIVVPAEVAPGTLSTSGGAGVLSAPASEIDMRNTQTVQWVQSILTGPSAFSMEVDTVENPTLPLTGQLRGTDLMNFQIPTANSSISLYTLRASSGEVIAGTVIFDVNYRLAAGAQINSIDIDGKIIAPPVTADPSGTGNVYEPVGVQDTGGLAALNGMVRDPEAHQINLRSTPAASSVTAALAAPNNTPAAVAAVIPIVEVKDLSTFAPGELVEIYGTNLAKVTTDLSGWPGSSLPAALNGVTVSVGGQSARLLYVSPTQVDAMLPFETPTGSQVLTANNGNAPSAPIDLNVASIAPAVYNFAFKNVDFSLVSSANPAHAGDVLVFYTTGMGQTNAALVTGQTTPLGPPFFNTQPVTATMGGVNANVVYSIAAPPYVTGLYQMAVTVPSGLGPGSVPFVATSGGLESNSIQIEVR